MKIAVLGTRGFPDIQGGVEAHCQNLYPRLAKMGCEVTIFGRAPYLKNGDSPHLCVDNGLGTVPIFQGVKIIPLNCPKNKFLEAIVHTFKGVFQAKKLSPDVLHIHAVGPALMVPVARMLGLKVVFTHHGPDYERKKWGLFAKLILRMGEFFGVTFANEVIAISQVIADDIKAKYGRKVNIIPNGVVIPELEEKWDSPIQQGKLLVGAVPIFPGKYVLAVGRFVPEKGFGDLIEAYKQFMDKKNGDRPHLCADTAPGTVPIFPISALVIAGDADHEDNYSRQLKKKAKETPNVVLTGFITGKPLQELYSHAGLFVLPSYSEGLPIVLLEAMSYGLSCIVSDIPANREVGLSDRRYFKPGDIGALAQKLREFINIPLGVEEYTNQIKIVRERYNWDRIAEKTLEVYRSR